MTEKTKSVASETDVPSGLDVVPMEPGTIVGSRDQQGADGTVRTDRPGEILGTPAHFPADEKRRTANRERETSKADYVTSEVDRANREELPMLGGPIDDGWEPGDSKGTKAKAAKATAADEAAIAATVRAQSATRTTDLAPANRMPAPAAPRDSGIRVSDKVDRG